MTLPRRKFTKEFKKAAVQRLQSEDSVAEVARACGVTPQMLRRWREELTRYRVNAFPGYGKRRSSAESRTEPVVFRVTEDEYDRLKAACSATGARSLSQFARRQIFLPVSPGPSLAEIEGKLSQLTAALLQLKQMIAKHGGTCAGARGLRD